MAYILKGMKEDKLQEKLTEKAYEVTMEFFKNNPKKTVCKLGDKIKIRKTSKGKRSADDKYTIDYRR